MTPGVTKIARHEFMRITVASILVSSISALIFLTSCSSPSKLPSFEISSISIDSKGDKVFWSGFRGEVYVWNRERGKEIQVVRRQLSPEYSPSICRLSPDGRKLVVAHQGVLETIDSQSLESIAKSPAVDLPIECIEWRQDNAEVVFSWGKGNITIWNSRSNQMTTSVLSDHRVVYLSRIKNGDILMATDAGTILKWTPATRTSTEIASFTPSLIFAFDGCDGIAAISAWDSQGKIGGLFAINLDNQKELPRLIEGHRGAIRSMAIDCQNHKAVTAGLDGSVKMWSLPQFTELKTVEATTASWKSVAISGDGQLVVAVGRSDKGPGNLISVWSTSTGSQTDSLTEDDFHSLPRDGRNN